VWPHVEGEFADHFNSLPKYLVSSTITNPTWANTILVKGDVVDGVRRIKEEQAGDIVVHGSAQLAQTLFEHDLVDALHLMVYPVIVGAGKRLFGDTSATKRLELEEAKTVGNGIHILIYGRG